MSLKIGLPPSPPSLKPPLPPRPSWLAPIFARLDVCTALRTSAPHAFIACDLRTPALGGVPSLLGAGESCTLRRAPLASGWKPGGIPGGSSPWDEDRVSTASTFPRTAASWTARRSVAHLRPGGCMGSRDGDGRWEVGGGRWEVGGGRWEAGGRRRWEVGERGGRIGGVCATCRRLVGTAPPHNLLEHLVAQSGVGPRRRALLPLQRRA